MGGAWKTSATNVIENVVEIPLDDLEPVQGELALNTLITNTS